MNVEIDHGKGRWAVKNDSSTPPTDANVIQSVTPSDVYGWLGMDVHCEMTRNGNLRALPRLRGDLRHVQFRQL
jgi:hypothetical protein